MASQQKIDPMVVFLGGAFLGLTVGPEAIRIARTAFENRSGEIASLLVDKLVNSLTSSGGTHDHGFGSPAQAAGQEYRQHSA